MVPNVYRGHHYPGLLLLFEGPDGSGKTTQMRRVMVELEKTYEVTTFREPGSTKIGEEIRNVLLHTKNEMMLTTELLLYQAARAQLVEEQLRPALEKRQVVCLDRYHHSSTAYQGGAGGMDLDQIRFISTVVTKGIEPDRTYLFDVDPRVAAGRINPLMNTTARTTGLDRIESRGFEFHTKVREAYLRLAQSKPEEIRIIDANRDMDAIYADVKSDLESYLVPQITERLLRKTS